MINQIMLFAGAGNNNNTKSDYSLADSVKHLRFYFSVPGKGDKS